VFKGSSYLNPSQAQIQINVKPMEKQINLTNKFGDLIGCYNLTPSIRGFDLFLTTKPCEAGMATLEPEAKINIFGIRDIENLDFRIDSYLGISPQNTRILTPVFAARYSLDFDSAVITLPKTKDVNVILYCPDFDFDSFICPYWEITSIPFTQTQTHIEFTVNQFSAYAGASLNIINVQSYPMVGGNWTVGFDTTGTANLTIIAVNGTKFGKDLEFLELRCGNQNLNSNLYYIVKKTEE
jgi:hypothetical protein